MKKLRNLKHIFIIVLISLMMIFVSIMIFSAEFSSSINGFFVYRTTSGIWQDKIYTHTLQPSAHIAIIAIDEKTLNSMQATSDQKMLTIPKSRYRELIEKLEGAGAKAIAFDIVFQNADPDETLFAESMQSYQNITIASMQYNGEKCLADINGNGSGVTCPGAPRSVYAGIPWGSVDIDGPYTRPLFIDISSSPYANWKVASGSVRIRDLQISSLPLALLRTQDRDDLSLPSFLEKKENKVLNPYLGPPGSYPTTSLSEVLLMTRVELINHYSGKYIFIGESGTLIHDSIISPVTGTQMDGVELHAHFLDGLLQNKMLTPIPDQTMWITTILLAIFSTILYFLLPKFISPIFAIVMMVAILWVSRYLYDIQRLLVDIFPLFLAGGILTFPMTFIYQFFVVDREKRYIENAFSHYIDPKMVEMIDMEEVKMVLGGEQRELSVFFSDIAGFTTISEQLSPPDLFYLMSLYLSRMTDILKHEGGTLDKYIGDAVMGFFGAPVSQSDHAIRACRTAIAMRKALPDLNREILARGILPLDFRVGIATGTVMVGNIGSEDHFNYTVLGDSVNLASRLEATGKEYHVHILISEGTRSQIGDMFRLREIDTITVQGKTEGVKIYELLGDAGDIIDSQIYAIYSEALSLYRAGSYLDAGKLWETQIESDPPSRIMANRCLEILEGRVHIEDGIYHMDHK